LSEPSANCDLAQQRCLQGSQHTYFIQITHHHQLEFITWTSHHQPLYAGSYCRFHGSVLRI